MNKLINQLKAFWNSLPPWAKGCLFIGASAASGALKKYFDAPAPCLTLHCMAVIGLSALHVGAIAAVGWLMRSPLAQSLLGQANPQSASAPTPTGPSTSNLPR